jgi:hypothetical protein
LRLQSSDLLLLRSSSLYILAALLKPTQTPTLFKQMPQNQHLSHNSTFLRDKPRDRVYKAPSPQEPFHRMTSKRNTSKQWQKDPWMRCTLSPINSSATSIYSRREVILRKRRMLGRGIRLEYAMMGMMRMTEERSGR